MVISSLIKFTLFYISEMYTKSETLVLSKLIVSFSKLLFDITLIEKPTLLERETLLVDCINNSKIMKS